MAISRSFLLFFWVLLSTCYPSVSQAGWWFSKQDPWEKSGLNLQQGYDQNTVVSLSGTIVKVDLGIENGPALAEVKTETETVSLVLGPGSYWEEHGISLESGDQVNVRGSRAQGKDGVVYIMVQTISTADNVHSAILRNPAGRSVWSGGSRQMTPRPMPMHQMRGGQNH